jgi:hypothetical protein
MSGAPSLEAQAFNAEMPGMTSTLGDEELKFGSSEGASLFCASALLRFRSYDLKHQSCHVVNAGVASANN